MKYIQIGNVFIGISNAKVTVSPISETVSEVSVGESDPHVSDTAFRVVGSQADITAEIANFLEKSQKLLVLEEAAL